ncbi:unnamed protein product [Schistosoma curassoni]|uniref:Uncharacterized protein n=1 Tax=Schistosoma curassoni TaxID=6186 RepID=A0A183KQM0_9TREM|nr:unnamed protein product [Schistosoma curassoni]
MRLQKDEQDKVQKLQRTVESILDRRSLLLKTKYVFVLVLHEH